uniref:CRAL/TRIO domain protein n=1 Tax=Mimivirus LCMiAC02 TaxID=2506609 RepID=A0A481Z181_9VIRU|nr:MAG: CRAL/TRIO domain protein [Mimivirus LCMiAC02]
MSSFIDKLNFTINEFKIFEHLRNKYRGIISDRLLGVIVRQQRKEKKYYKKCKEIIELERSVGLSNIKISYNILKALKKGAIIYNQNLQTYNGIPLIIVKPFVMYEQKLQENDRMKCIFYTINQIITNFPEVTTKGIHIIIYMKNINLCHGLAFISKVFPYLKKLPARPQKIEVYKPADSVLFTFNLLVKQLMPRHMIDRVKVLDTITKLKQSIGRENILYLCKGNMKYDIGNVVKNIFCKGDKNVCAVYDKI